MPKANQEPDPNRRQTHATNATAHPGKVVLEVLADRRPQEDIENDKKAKQARCEARERKKIGKAKAIKSIADFENEMALDDEIRKTTFPRYQTEVNAPSEQSESKNKKRKGMKSSSNREKKSSKAHPKSELGNAFDTDVDTSDDNHHTNKAKKQKMSARDAAMSQVLCRTESYIRPEDFAVPSNIAMEEMVTPTEVEEYTPMPSKKYIMQIESENEDPHTQSEDDDFVTLKALRTKTPITQPNNDSYSNVAPMTQTETETETGTETETRTDSGDQELKKSKVKKSKDSTIKPGKASKQEKPNLKMIDLIKRQKKVTGTKEKDAFRKEVEERRALVSKEKDKVKQAEIASKRDSIPSASDSTDSKVTASESLKDNTLASRHTEIDDFGSASRDKASKSSSATSKSDTKSRNSATAGNGIGIHSMQVQVRTSSVKPKSTSAETIAGFSDGDDSVERESILQSLAKGMQRVSSGAIVKVETGSNDSRKTRSRSKKNIISPEVFSGWTRFITPNFVYFYFCDLSPWPTTGAIEACAQILWDWRFGVSNPLDFTKSPAYVQLLNQKLCDIRSQSASAALANLDAEFQYQLTLRYDDTKIVELRQRHAKGLSKDKRFIFGKYTVSENGQVCKMRPYQGRLVLRTFSASFKHIRDANLNPDRDEKDGPLPSNLYPKNLLAIAIAAVERAIELALHNDYDFETNKLIPKPDPNHPMQKPTTSMFSFSKAIWEPRAEFYLNKGISKLKDKEWESIMNAAAEYSNIIMEKQCPSKGKQKARVQATEEERELEYDSDSESSDKAV